MRMDEIRAALKAEPFKPFYVHAADGRKFRVGHPEFVALNTPDRSIHVVEPRVGWHILDLMLLTGLSFDENGRTQSRKKKKS